MPMYTSLRSYVSRLQDVLGRKKHSKPVVISEPFGFKKEDALGQLPGIPDAELHMLREKAAASIVGSAIAVRTYAHAADLDDDLAALHAYDAPPRAASRASSSLSSFSSSSPLTPTTTEGFGRSLRQSYTLRNKASAGSFSGAATPDAHPLSSAVALTSHPTRTYSNATTASCSSSSGGGGGGTASIVSKKRLPRVLAVGRPTAATTTAGQHAGQHAPVVSVSPPTVTEPEEPVPPSPTLSAVPPRLRSRPLPKPKSLPTLRVELASTEPYAPSGLSAPPALVRASSMGFVRGA